MPFEVTTGNRRQTYCSLACGSKAQALLRKIVIDEATLRRTVASTGSYIEACEKLGVTPWTLYRRMRELGIRREKRPLRVRPDGYWNYSTKSNHRRIMEEHLGVRLTPKQGVHHIDGSKSNNDLDNLIVTESVRDHMLLHGSLQRCAFELFRKGTIRFNRDTREYFLATP